jgi:hypothetical protein
MRSLLCEAKQLCAQPWRLWAYHRGSFLQEDEGWLGSLLVAGKTDIRQAATPAVTSYGHRSCHARPWRLEQAVWVARMQDASGPLLAF